MDNEMMSGEVNTSLNPPMIMDVSGRLNRIQMMFPGCFVAEFLVKKDAELPGIIRFADEEYNLINAYTCEAGNDELIHCAMPGKFGVYQNVRCEKKLSEKDSIRTLNTAMTDIHPYSSGRDSDFFGDDEYLMDMMKYFTPEKGE
jgi:hypothetical protein